ncbi:transcriptional regulator GfcR [Halomarina oriensis]|uniref:Transcriptional regulator GfcR n=1 Tax=Halomarina oriensis TaxID=671145 RepID=A0A6B0GJG9_9EURY|nr:transcriptional regulator GfcR [Halomarina oriensis]MWG33539.1 orotate phosphoribosyltransferase-like protein [Halomarina oriensis]
MKNVDDLIENATALAQKGLSKGEIADELNVSRETARWLVERGDTSTGGTADDVPREPTDVHVDWSAVGTDSDRLEFVGRAISDMVQDRSGVPEVTIGVEKAGVPLATVVSRDLESDLATYTPRKHQWDEGDIEDLGGSFSRNFAPVEGRDCIVVDDTVTSGTTLTETISAVEERGGNPVACAVLVDKQGVDEVEGVPVYSLIQVIRV